MPAKAPERNPVRRLNPAPFQRIREWAIQDSNLGPLPYQGLPSGWSIWLVEDTFGSERPAACYQFATGAQAERPFNSRSGFGE
jgi:hypothetical protein